MQPRHAVFTLGLVSAVVTGGCDRDQLRFNRGQRTDTVETHADNRSKTIEQAQKQSEQALDEAKDAQAHARREQQQAARAQEKVLDKQRELAEAEKKAQQELAEAHDAQVRAQQQAAAAQGTVQSSNQQVVLAQRDVEQQHLQQVKSEEQRRLGEIEQAETAANARPQPSAPTPPQALSASGMATQVSGGGFLLRRENEDGLRVKLDPGASILVDGRKADLASLPENAHVNVSYRLEQGEAVATKIEAHAPAQQVPPQQ